MWNAASPRRPQSWNDSLTLPNPREFGSVAPGDITNVQPSPAMNSTAKGCGGQIVSLERYFSIDPRCALTSSRPPCKDTVGIERANTARKLPA